MCCRCSRLEVIKQTLLCYYRSGKSFATPSPLIQVQAVKTQTAETALMTQELFTFKLPTARWAVAHLLCLKAEGELVTQGRLVHTAIISSMRL